MSTTDAAPSDSTAPEPNATVPATGVAHPRSSSGFIGLALSASAAAVAVWLIVCILGYPFYVAPPAAGGGVNPQAPTAEELARTARVARLNSITLMTLCGSLLGVGLAIGDTFRRQSVGRAALAVVAGGIAGGFAGIAGGGCEQWILAAPRLYQLDTLYGPAREIALQATCWGLIGLGIGGGLALSGCRPPRALVVGAVAGVFSVLLYSALSAVVGIFIPAGEDLRLVPAATVNRLLWLLTPALCIAVGISLFSPSERCNAGRTRAA